MMRSSRQTLVTEFGARELMMSMPDQRVTACAEDLYNRTRWQALPVARCGERHSLHRSAFFQFGVRVLKPKCARVYAISIARLAGLIHSFYEQPRALPEMYGNFHNTIKVTFPGDYGCRKNSCSPYCNGITPEQLRTNLVGIARRLFFYLAIMMHLRWHVPIRCNFPLHHRAR
jgi:hypothetical protein